MSKIVVVTGASGGLGKALVKAFAANSWQVIGTGRSIPPTSMPAGAAYSQFDASDPTAAESFWQDIKQQHPNAEMCLVNNAGGYVSGSLTDTKAEDYEQQMRSSYFTAVYMTRSLALSFAKARIINVVSSSALAAHKNNSAYGAAKAAEMHFFQSLQAEFTSSQYQITNLYPDNIASHGPTNSAMTPEDFAQFVRLLAESTASFYLKDATVSANT